MKIEAAVRNARALLAIRKSWEVLTLIAGGSSMDNPNSNGGVRCGRFQLPHVNRTRLARISNSGDWFDHRLCAHAGGRHSERSPLRLFPISGGSAAGFCHPARRLAGWAAQADGAGAVSGCVGCLAAARLVLINALVADDSSAQPRICGLALSAVGSGSALPHGG